MAAKSYPIELANENLEFQDDPTAFLTSCEQRLKVLQGQLEILEKLENQIKGWREWTEELDGHWSKVKTGIFEEIRKIAGSADRSCCQLRPHKHEET